MISLAIVSSELDDILHKAVEGERLTSHEGVTLLRSHDLPTIAPPPDAFTPTRSEQCRRSS